MAKRITCPRKGSTYMVQSNPVIATGDCKNGKVEVATINSGTVLLPKSELKVTRGKKRAAAQQVLASSDSPITKWLAAKALEASGSRKTAQAAHAVAQQVAASNSMNPYGYSAGQWQRSGGSASPAVVVSSGISPSMLRPYDAPGRVVSSSAVSTRAPVSFPEAWQYMHAGEAPKSVSSEPGSYQFFDGLGVEHVTVGQALRHPFLGPVVVLAVRQRFGETWADVKRLRDGEVHKGINILDLE